MTQDQTIRSRVEDLLQEAVCDGGHEFSSYVDQLIKIIEEEKEKTKKEIDAEWRIITARKVNL